MGCAANKQIKPDTNQCNYNNIENIEVQSVFVIQTNKCRSQSESNYSIKEKQMIELNKKKVSKGSRFKEDLVYTSKLTTKDHVNNFQALNCHQIDAINLEYKRRNYKNSYEFSNCDKQDFDCFETTSDRLSNKKATLMSFGKATLEYENFSITSSTERISSENFSEKLRDDSLKSTNLSKCNS